MSVCVQEYPEHIFIISGLIVRHKGMKYFLWNTLFLKKIEMSFNKCMLHTLHYSLHSPVISNLIRHKHSEYGIKFVILP